MNFAERWIDKWLSLLVGRQELRTTINNSGWLFVDRVLRMAIGFLVNVQVTRYLGPVDYGTWNYVLAFSGIFVPFVSFGIESVCLRDLIKLPQQADRFLGSTLLIKGLGALAGIGLGLATFWWSGSYRQELSIPLTSYLCIFLLQPLDVYELFFLSKSKSKYPVYLRMALFAAFSGAKLYALQLSASLYTFMYIHLTEVATSLVGLPLVFWLKAWSPFRVRVDWGLVRNYLGQHWHLFFATLANLLYMKVDQVMLYYLHSEREVGLYAAGLRISEIGYFVPIIVVNSMMPGWVKAFETNRVVFESKFARTLKFLVISALLMAIACTFGSSWVIATLYGSRYSTSASVLTVHSWTSVFYFSGIAFYNYNVIQSFTQFGLCKSMFGLVLNVVLNYFIIPLYGALGAAYTTLVSFALAEVLFLLAFRATRPLFFVFWKSFLPWK